jgi:hypothetical protein
MELRGMHQLLAIAVMSGVALTAAAQGGTSGTAGQNSAASPSTAASSGTSGTSGTPGANAQGSTAGAAGSKATGATGSHHARATKHHAGTRHAMRHARKNDESMTRNDSGESQYRAALRRCVQGPEGQRDSCLDQAIRDNGRA